jgi:hypothetical protein
MIWKALAITSIILNFFLGYLALQKRETAVVERVVIETHPVKKIEDRMRDKDFTSAPTKSKTISAEVSSEPLAPNSLDESEFQEASEKMESDRREFLVTELGISEENLLKHYKIVDEFHKKSSDFWGKNPMRELSIKDRRELLNLEEAFHQKLERLHGKAKWEKYLKFRESYNNKAFKAQMEENRSFIFMGI